MVSMLTAEERVVLQTEAALDALSMLLQQQSLGVSSDRIASLRDSCEAMAAKLGALDFDQAKHEDLDPPRSARSRGRTNRRRGSGDKPLGIERVPSAASQRGRCAVAQHVQPSSSDAASMADERGAASPPTEDEDDQAPPSFGQSKMAQRFREEHEEIKNNRLNRRRAASCGSIRYGQRRGGTSFSFAGEQPKSQHVPHHERDALAGVATSTLERMQEAQRTLLTHRANQAIAEQASTTEDDAAQPPAPTVRAPAAAPSGAGRGRMREKHQAARANRLSQRRPSFFGAQQIRNVAEHQDQEEAPSTVQATQPPSDFADAEGE
uniref:Uncharacterized protein n=1 Tax=Calcidiscus leptoporus TaxID=127549 RepID=A0A7S0ITR4_9EUKA